MNDTRRRILELVAEGRLSPPEAARLLQDPSADELLAVALDEPLPGAPIERLEVVGTGGQITIVGDESIADIHVEGPHTIRRHDEAAIVEFGGSGQPYFNMQGGGVVLQGIGRDAMAITGLTPAGGGRVVHRHSQGVPLTIRANPALPLTVSVTAGGLAVEGMTGPIRCESISSVSSIRDIVGPLSASINAGSLSAEGWFREGESRIDCSMGSLRIGLRPDADVRLHINEVLGRVKVDLPADDPHFQAVEHEVAQDPQSNQVYFKEWVIGSGQGSLILDANMARVSIKQSTPQLARIEEIEEEGDVAVLAADLSAEFEVVVIEGDLEEPDAGADRQ